MTHGTTAFSGGFSVFYAELNKKEGKYQKKEKEEEREKKRGGELESRKGRREEEEKTKRKERMRGLRIKSEPNRENTEKCCTIVILNKQKNKGRTKENVTSTYLFC